MAEEENLGEFSIEGLLKIVSKETSIILTKGPADNPAVVRKDTSKLNILTDDGETISIDFNRDVGYELTGNKVSYSIKKEVKTCVIDSVVPNIPIEGRYKIVTQMLIPQDITLPQYITQNYTLLD